MLIHSNKNILDHTTEIIVIPVSTQRWSLSLTHNQILKDIKTHHPEIYSTYVLHEPFSKLGDMIIVSSSKYSKPKFALIFTVNHYLNKDAAIKALLKLKRSKDLKFNNIALYPSPLIKIAKSVFHDSTIEVYHGV